jgi:hypothetical protein
MRPEVSIRKPRVERVRKSSREGPNGNYERKLIEWGCSDCGFFEERSFRTRLSSAEQDAYAICRFTGEPVDLIWEARACLKTTESVRSKGHLQLAGAGRRDCKHAA